MCLGPERAPGENLQPWPQWLQWSPQAPALGPGPAHPVPGSSQGMPFADTKDGRPPMPSWRGGRELYGTEVEVVTLFSWVV